MKKLVALSATVVALATGFAAPANADTVSLPYGGSATLTIPDVTLTPGGGCVSHFGSFSISHLDYWNVDITANGPTTWPASDYLYGTGSQSRIVELLMCPSFDGPGTYTASGLLTVEDPYSYNQQEVLISDQFIVSNPAPPPPPPPPVVVPPPPAPTTADVTGSVSSKGINNGVKLTFKSKALPAGTVVGKRLTWTVVVDRKIRKTFSQSPNQIRRLKVASPDRSGRHVVKILRNGKPLKSFFYRA